MVWNIVAVTKCWYQWIHFCWVWCSGFVRQLCSQALWRRNKLHQGLARDGKGVARYLHTCSCDDTCFVRGATKVIAMPLFWDSSWGKIRLCLGFWPAEPSRNLAAIAKL